VFVLGYRRTEISSTLLKINKGEFHAAQTFNGAGFGGRTDGLTPTATTNYAALTAEGISF
jgi:hypothetical protein